MARILIGTVPILGHVNPFLPLVRALVARGHEVAWLTGEKHGGRVEAAGARFVPYVHARDYDDAATDAAFPGRAERAGIEQLKFDMKHLFLDAAPGQVKDLEAEVARFRPDVLFIDPAFVGGFLAAERLGVPLAVLGVLPLGMSGRDVAPFGLGLPPDASALGRMRNRTLQWAVENVVFREVQRHAEAIRASLGMGPGGWFLDAGRRADLFLQPTIPGFEYPRSDRPACVRFIGLLPAEVPSGTPPSFSGELAGTTPVVHVTQGTIANAAPDLIAPALAGLASEDVLVVVSTGNRPPAELGLVDVPRNARIATFLSYPELLPRTRAMVTNGGYGGVQLALSHGVPLVVAGTTEDKPEVAARVAWSGAGIDLRTSTPSPEAVRRAVRALLDDARYGARARELAAEYARYDAVRLGVDLLEQLAHERGAGRTRDSAAA